jgi:translation initiation factor 2A
MTHQFAIRDQHGTSLRSGPAPGDKTYALPATADSFKLSKGLLDVEYSANGELALAVDSEKGGVNVYDANDGRPICAIPVKAAAAVAFSPSGSFVQTWEKLTDELQNAGGNLRVWSARTGEYLAGFSQKSFSKEAWPYIKWSADEVIACQQITNGVHLFNGRDIGKGVISKISQDKLKYFSISPGPAPYRIVTFVPEIKDQPAVMKLFSYPNLAEPVAQKKMFRASDAEFIWSPTGSAVLIRTSTDVDASGGSYYGESKLTFFSSDGKSEGNVALSKDGPVHDTAWSPSGKEFVVVYGTMPAKATLFDFKCNAVFDYGTGSRNTVSWAPHGRFLMLGGFGNISGHLELWDNNKKKQLCTTRVSDATSWSWSPCSRFLLFCTLFPRLRVDNGFRIFKYDGTLIHTEKVPGELYQVTWRPAKPGSYADRPASPGAGARSVPGASGPGGANMPSAAAPKAYVPPHLRGKDGATPARPAFSLHDYEQAGKVGGGASALGGSSLPPGAVAEEDQKLSKGALKKKKAKEKAERERLEAEVLEETSRALAAAGISVPAGAGAGGGEPEGAREKDYSNPDDVAKRIKAIQKKLKSAKALVDDEAAGKELNVDQKAKISAIPEMEKELQEFEGKLKALATN